MHRKPILKNFDYPNEQTSTLGLMINISYWKWLQDNAPAIYYAKMKLHAAGEKFDEIKLKLSSLKIELQQKFYVWFYRKLKQMTSQDSAVFYEVLSSNSPNPLSSPAAMDAAGGVSIFIRSLRLLLIPLQKLMQYYQWKLAPEGSTAKLNPPTFTRQDAFYIGLDIVLLGLTAAAFFVGAPIPAAAIALTAAIISAGVATYHYAKFLYQGYQLKKEKDEVDALFTQFKPNQPDPFLNEKDQEFLNQQRVKAEADQPNKTFSDREILMARSETLGQRIKNGINNRYQKVRQTLGFGLTMLSIVAVSCILGGAVLGPVGVPLIMTGVALGILASGIAIGMMIANAVKKSRDEKEAQIGKKSLDVSVEQENTETIQHGKQLTTLYSQSPHASRHALTTPPQTSFKSKEKSADISWSLEKRILTDKTPVNDSEFQANTSTNDKTPKKD